MGYVVDLQCRPIDVWPGELTKKRSRSPFTSDYGYTMKLLDTELRHLKATGVVLLMALSSEDIRIDGRPRAGARPSHPGIILAFTGKDGAVRFPCDTFDDWTANLRAIANTLDLLRRIDRYGVTKRGEQYKGWAALPAPNGDHFTLDSAVDWLNAFLARGHAPSKTDAESVRRLILSDRNIASKAVRDANLGSHPDRGGDPIDFKKVQRCKELLEQHHGVSL